MAASPRTVLMFLFAASGAAGLILQLVWTRWLGLVAGTFAAATAITVVQFMLGMAGGYLLGGRRARGLAPAAALRGYAALEALIGLCAFAAPWLLAPGAPLPVVLATHFASPLAAALVAGLLVLPPAALMGATLPVVVRALRGESPRTLGPLYAANALGGAGGALLSAFVLMPVFGLTMTGWIAGAINLLVAGIALRLARHASFTGAPGTVEPVTGARVPSLPLAFAAVSGFLALGFEIALTRLLVISLTGSSVYALASVLAAYLFGLAAGGWLAGRRPPGDPAAAYAGYAAALGLMWAASLTTPLWGWAPLTLVEFWWSEPSFLTREAVTLSAAGVLLLAFTTASGYALPALAAAGARPGPLFAANAVAGAAGAALAGFVLLPAFGLHRTLLGLGAGSAVSAAAALVAARPRQRLPAFTAAVAAAGIAVVLPRTDADATFSGIHDRPHQYRSADAGMSPSAIARTLGAVLFREDGAGATITVRGITNRQAALFVNGKPDGSTNPADLVTMILTGHLPALHHPAPRRALLVGLGTGLTLGAVMRHPVASATVVEIEPAVYRAAPWFARFTGGAHLDPRVAFVFDDGRHFLATQPASYDLILTEVSNIFVSGMVHLFTREYHELVRRRLAPNGIACHWIHYYRAGLDDVRCAARTMQSVFPHTSLWMLGQGDCLMIASAEPYTIDPGAWRARLAEPLVTQDLRRAGLADPGQLFSYLAMSPEELRRFAGTGPLCTDDRPRLEFSAPRQPNSNALILANLAAITGFGPLAPVPLRVESARERLALGRCYADRGLLNRAAVELERALVLAPTLREARALLAKIRSWRTPAAR